MYNFNRVTKIGICRDIHQIFAYATLSISYAFAEKYM